LPKKPAPPAAPPALAADCILDVSNPIL